MFGGIGIQEILVVLVVGLLVFGAARLPKIARSLGLGIKEFKKTIKGIEEDESDETPKVNYSQGYNQPQQGQYNQQSQGPQQPNQGQNMYQNPQQQASGPNPYQNQQSQAQKPYQNQQDQTSNSSQGNQTQQAKNDGFNNQGGSQGQPPGPGV